MMEKLTTYVCLLIEVTFFASSNVSAQSFQKGNMIINAGLGLGSTYSWAAGGLGIPLGGGLEYGVTDLEVGSIGVGGDVGFVSGSGLTIIYVGGKETYHFNELLKLEKDEVDLYGGLGLYYRHFNFSGTSFNFGSGIVPSFHLGGRYYFADNIGGYAELGNNWGWLNLGVIFKL